MKGQLQLSWNLPDVLGLRCSPTPFHLCNVTGDRLKANGFTELSEKDTWASSGMVEAGGKYFYTRNQSTLVAFTVGGAYKPGGGFKIVGAHTDSPVLKVKPVSKKVDKASGCMQLGVECYGGGLWHTCALASIGCMA